MEIRQRRTFGELLEGYRRRAALTQEQLAEKSGTTAQTISYYESDRRKEPSKEVLGNLAMALGLTEEERAALLAAVTRSRGPRAAPARRTPGMPWASGAAVPTRLIGREQELEAIASRLLHGDSRVLTLTGPGGVGKTRLALAVAGEVASSFPGGQHTVSLAALRDPGLVVPAIAAAVGVREEGGQPLPERLGRHIGGRRVLLLLDSFEPVAAAAVDVAQLVACCPALRVLATSRVALRVRAEAVVPVAPLAVPEAGAAADPAALLRSAAVRLFVERAQAVTPEFHVTPLNAAALVQVCRRLDGLPLALELAAARLVALPLPALAARLDDRLALLTDGPLDLPPRQRTLRGTIDWSYELLTPAEKDLFRRMAIFSGGCTLRAAHAVCSPDEPEHSVLDRLASLVSKSLLCRGGAGDGEPRFSLLDTIRAFALERLVESGDVEALRQSHAFYFAAAAWDGQLKLVGPEQMRWLSWLEEEHANLRAVLQWAWESKRAALGVYIGVALSPFWQMRGHVSEGRRWLEQFLGLIEREGAASAPREARAMAWAETARLADCQGDHRRALEAYPVAVTLYRELGDQEGLATVLQGLAILAAQRGDVARAASLGQEIMLLVEALGDRHRLLQARLFLAQLAYEQDAGEQALRLYRECVALARDLKDRRALGVCLHCLSSLLLSRNDTAGATSCSEESLAIAREIGIDQSVADALLNLGHCAFARGDYQQAAVRLEESLALARRVGDNVTIVGSLGSLALVFQAQGEFERSMPLLAEALPLVPTTDRMRSLPHLVEACAAVILRRGQPARAVRLCAAATALGGRGVPHRQRGHHPTAPGDIRAARAALGDDAFMAAWAAGQALTFEQLVAEAVS